MSVFDVVIASAGDDGAGYAQQTRKFSHTCK